MSSSADTGSEIVDAQFVAAAQTYEQLPPPVSIEVAFAGRSNVGKSSLLNRLMNRRNLARTSSTPGCTRQIVFFETRRRTGGSLTLVDLPGYGYASRSKTERLAWGELIERYLLERPTLLAVAVLVDARRGLQDDDLDLLKLLAEPRPNRRPVRALIIATKLDKVPRPQRTAVLRGIAEGSREVIGFSTELPETTPAVWARLASALQ